MKLKLWSFHASQARSTRRAWLAARQREFVRHPNFTNVRCDLVGLTVLSPHWLCPRGSKLLQSKIRATCLSTTRSSALERLQLCNSLRNTIVHHQAAKVHVSVLIGCSALSVGLRSVFAGCQRLGQIIHGASWQESACPQFPHQVGQGQ